MKTKFELTPSELRCLCDPAIFKFKDTSEIEPLDEVIGQQRAVLTGVAAGRPDDAGDFPEGTVFGAVQKQLKQYTQQAYRLKKEFGNLY